MQTNEKRKNNIFLIIFLSITLIAFAFLAKFAWAKYISSVKGDAQADIAHFSFYVSEKSNNSLTIDLADTRLPNDTTSVHGTTVAPGTKGALAFDINADVSDVSIEYNIGIDITEVPQNLIFYSDSEMKNAIYHSEKVINIKGYFSSSTENKKSTNLIYWQWPLETGLTQEEIEQNDETDSLSMGDLITIDIHVIGQQAKTNPIENQHTITLNANGGVINGYGNSELMTKIINDGQYGELPETKKIGYTFEGWYTESIDGEKISADTLVQQDVTCYAQWTPNPYTLTINPNGGTYKSQIANTQITQNCDTLLGLEEPVREGYTFAGWSIDGGGSMIRGMPFGDRIRDCDMVTRATQIDASGDKYSKYAVNLKNNTNPEMWPFIQFPIYEYVLGHEYRISAYIRANELSGFWMPPEFRHSAIPNDHETSGRKVKDITFSDEFVEYTLTRSFKNDKIWQSSTEYDIRPLIEIYFHIRLGSTGVADIDIKNITIYDVTAGRYVTDGVYGGYIYKYGSKNATLTAKWIKNN